MAGTRQGARPSQSDPNQASSYTICVLSGPVRGKMFPLTGPLGDSLHDPPLHVLTEF